MSMAFHHQLSTRRLAAALFVVLAAASPQRAAARPVATAAMDVSSASAPVGGGGGDAFVRAGKWLPLPAMGGGMRFPMAGVSMPWMAGAPPAMAGPGVQLVPPYVGATRQEQLSLWASLFNPFQVRPRLPVVVAGAGAGDTTASPGGLDIPAIAGVSPEKTATVAEPAGEPKWGVFLGNNGNN